MQVNAHWVGQLGVFFHCPQELLIRLSFTFQQQTYPPLETILRMGSAVRSMEVRVALVIHIVMSYVLSF